MGRRRGIVSVGYEGRSLCDFLQLLKAQGVTTVFDIRELPLSRRKGFSKTALRTRLLEEGIEYAHLKFAGNPYRKQGATVRECLALYKRHLDANPDVVARTVDELKTRGRVAVLCFEREHDQCHRSILLNALEKSFSVGGLTRVE